MNFPWGQCRVVAPALLLLSLACAYEVTPANELCMEGSERDILQDEHNGGGRERERERGGGGKGKWGKNPEQNKPGRDGEGDA